MKTLAGIAVFTVMFQAGHVCAAARVADYVYMNGDIYTQNAKRERAEAVAIKDGVFIAVGSDKDIEGYIGKGTSVVDLQGKMAMPGIVDGHGHYVRGLKREMFNCGFSSSTPAEAIADEVKKCAAKAKPGEWITGGAWASSYADTGKVHKSALDAVAPDNPVYLLDDTGHNGYVNSKALEVAGFTKDKAREMPAILTDESGEPTGILHEEAAGELTQAIPPLSDEKYQQVVKKSAEMANRYGITTFVEARTDRATLKAYHDVDEKEGLTARVIAFLQYETDFNESREKQLETIKNRESYFSDNVYANNVKFYLDGVPPAFTAALLNPYQAEALHEHHLASDFRGKLRMTPEEIRKDTIELDKKGVTMKFHASGSAAVREALNAVEAARKENPTGQLHHSIAHAGMVSKQDLPRFRELNVVADIAPPIWIPGPYSEAMIEALGKDRYARTPPTAELLEAGATIAYGSDWPSISSSINPWPHLESMVQREIGPEESIPLQAAFDTMTLGAAYSANLSSEIGSIEPGKSADMVVIDQDIFAVPVSDISDTHVLLTVFRGEPVYKDAQMIN
ncbi:amidohydrolase [Halomonas shantousis]